MFAGFDRSSDATQTGRRRGEPSVMSNRPLCLAHSMSVPETKPSARWALLWVQRPSVA